MTAQTHTPTHMVRSQLSELNGTKTSITRLMMTYSRRVVRVGYFFTASSGQKGLWRLHFGQLLEWLVEPHILMSTFCRQILGLLVADTVETSGKQWIKQISSSFQFLSFNQLCRKLIMCVPFRRTSFARRSFSTAAPLTWNSLPPAILNCDSLSTFKSRLKTPLFSTAFC